MIEFDTMAPESKIRHKDDMIPDSKDPKIDIDWTSIRGESVGSMTILYQFHGLCYLSLDLDLIHVRKFCSDYVLPGPLL